MNKKVFVEWSNDDQQLNFEISKLELNNFYKNIQEEEGRMAETSCIKPRPEQSRVCLFIAFFRTLNYIIYI